MLKMALKKTPRAMALLVVFECLESGQSLATLLPRYLEPLAEQQRPLAQEISYGTLRWYYRLDAILQKMLDKPLRGKKKIIYYLLLCGLYQILYLDKADYAVVKETVNTCADLQQAWAKGLVNAVLRRFLREQSELLSSLDKSYASRFAYPDWLITRIKLSWQKSAWPQASVTPQSILAAGNQRPPMTLRVHVEEDIFSYQQTLQQLNIGCTQSPVYNHTLTLDKARPVDELPGFSQGRVSVQDGAAQLAALLLDVGPQQRVLDACAAPGGKTMHIMDSQPQLDSLLALDVSAERLSRVEESRQRLNLSAQKLHLLAADASVQDWWDGRLFDRILLDAPCSATGVIRRHPDIKVLRRDADIAALTVLQAAILDNLWAMLKPGGRLLYATCSILREENDRQIVNFLQRNNDSFKDAGEIPISGNWGYAMPAGRQILPGEQGMDGFYYALLEKQMTRCVDENDNEQ